MSEYSNINIANVLANCNHSDYNVLLKLCLDDDCPLTIKDLEAHNYKNIKELTADYNDKKEESDWIASQNDINKLTDFISKCETGTYSQKHYQDAINKRQQLASQDENEQWESIRRSNNINTLRNFISKCEQGIYSKTHIEEARNLIEICDWGQVKNSNDITLITTFISKCRSGEYSKLFLSEAEQLIETIAEGAIANEWNALLNIPNDDEQLTQLNFFIQRYAQNPSPTAQKYISEANTLITRIMDERQAEYDWIAAKSQHEILPYVRFIENHPLSKYRNEAEQIVNEMKGDLLNDMKRAPFNYRRDQIFDLIDSKTLTRKELVLVSGVLTDRAYDHILQFPTLLSEQRALPLSKLENPVSDDINTDIIFFGIKGSGKTCVLSALMYLQGKKGFKYNPKGKGGGGNYAMELQRYASDSMLPPATDSGMVQVIDASITDEKNRVHPVAFIEMSGEKTAQFALMDNATDLDDLGPGAAGILGNNNKKLIFFVIDPVNDKEVTLGSSNISIKQSSVLDCITALLANHSQLMRKVQAMHIIVTKSDTLGDQVTPDAIQQMIDGQGYSVVLGNLRELCQKYPHINTLTNHEVGIFPFRVGKFMPGDTYTFDPTDAVNIMGVIRGNTFSIKPPTRGDKIRAFFESAFIN